jgi:hypothetical protein
MTDEAMSPLRRRMIEDMTIRKLGRKTQQDYIDPAYVDVGVRRWQTYTGKASARRPCWRGSDPFRRRCSPAPTR